MKKIRVGVVYGGRSGEHEVSVASAASIMKHLDRGRYEPVPIRIEKDGRWTLADKAPTSISAAEVIEHGRLDDAMRRSQLAQSCIAVGSDQSEAECRGHATIRSDGPAKAGPYVRSAPYAIRIRRSRPSPAQPQL